MFFFLAPPFFQNFLVVARCVVEVRTAKVQHEGANDDRHFEDEKFVVAVDELRDVMTLDHVDAQVTQSKINISLAAIRFGPFMNLQGVSSRRRRTDAGKNATMHPEPERLIGHQFALAAATVFLLSGN